MANLPLIHQILMMKALKYLYCCNCCHSQATYRGKIQFYKIKATVSAPLTSPLHQSSLDSSACFVLATDSVFIWQGKKATTSMKETAKSHANALYSKLKLQPWQSIIKEIEDGEVFICSDRVTISPYYSRNSSLTGLIHC